MGVCLSTAEIQTTPTSADSHFESGYKIILLTKSHLPVMLGWVGKELIHGLILRFSVSGSIGLPYSNHVANDDRCQGWGG